nr:MAG TPA: hypothetical protein [Caudoviricetes sp.]
MTKVLGYPQNLVLMMFSLFSQNNDLIVDGR